MECESTCPYCNEPVTLWVDTGDGAAVQSYVEDCSVCCRPWQVIVHCDEDGWPSAELRRMDD